MSDETDSAIDLVAPEAASASEDEVDFDIVNHSDKLIRGTLRSVVGCMLVVQ